MKNPTNIPDSVRACVYFSNPKKLDWKGQSALVITSVLNRGTWDAVRWIFQFYGEKAIRKVVEHPRRGLWFPKAFTFWVTFFNLNLKNKLKQRALFKL